MYEDIPHGDMPGDKIEIDQSHVEKAELIFPLLKEELDEIFETRVIKKAVVSVCGGSGVGKSEVASLLSYFLTEAGIKSYTLSGDNYPHRIPEENDQMRAKVYEEQGEEGLRAYLGSQQEIDFEKVSEIIAAFKAGQPVIALKRMGRVKGDIRWEDVDLSDTQVLMLEWTHGNSDLIQGVDIPILLNSTPEETLEHRRKRNRDKNVDSPLTLLVLNIEQDMLKRQAHKARFIISKQGELLSWDDYCNLMDPEEGR